MTILDYSRIPGTKPLFRHAALKKKGQRKKERKRSKPKKKKEKKKGKRGSKHKKKIRVVLHTEESMNYIVNENSGPPKD